jgi:GNAT superfamily N-acetyltransferase
LDRLQAIEVAAGAAFAEIGLVDVAEDPPTGLSALRGLRREGGLTVATDPEDRPVAVLAAGLLDGNVHIEQISVHPTHARRGIGRALIDHLAAGARDGGIAALTLTTFGDVPWNAPYYRRCGFTVLSDDELGDGLAAVLRAERERWPAGHPRVAMIRAL